MTKKLKWVEEHGGITLVLDTFIWFEICKMDNGKYRVFWCDRYLTTYATVQKCKDCVESYLKRLHKELHQYFGGEE